MSSSLMVSIWAGSDSLPRSAESASVPPTRDASLATKSEKRKPLAVSVTSGLSEEGHEGAERLRFYVQLPLMGEMSGKEWKCQWRWTLCNDGRTCTDLDKVPGSGPAGAPASHSGLSSPRTRCCSFCRRSRKPARETRVSERGEWTHLRMWL